MSSRAKGKRSVAKVKEYFKSQGYLVGDTEQVSKYAKVQDLYSDYCLTCKTQCEDYTGEGLVCKCGNKDSKQKRFPGFDLVAIKKGVVELVQVKTNSPATKKPYKQFASRFTTSNIKVVCATIYDRKGLRLQYYNKNGTIKEKDLRK